MCDSGSAGPTGRRRSARACVSQVHHEQRPEGQPAGARHARASVFEASGFEHKDKFGDKSQLFKSEDRVRRMSAKHLALLQTFHQPSPALATADQEQSIMDVLQTPADIVEAQLPRISAALEQHAPLVAFLSDAAEVKALQSDGGMLATDAAFQPVPADGHGAMSAAVQRWHAALSAGDTQGTAQAAQQLQQSNCCQVGAEWLHCSSFPSITKLCETVTSVKRFAACLVLNCTKPSLSKLILHPNDQVVMEVLHCILNQVKNHLQTIKLLVNRLCKADARGRPVVKSDEELCAWKSPNSDDTVARTAWYANGYVLHGDIARVVGFAEPMMGYHGNQCFKLLEKSDEVAQLPAVKLVSERLSAQPGVNFVSAWLGALRSTCQEIRRSKPCLFSLRDSIHKWFQVVQTLDATSAVRPKWYDCKTYDHFCCVHVLPQVLRFGNVVKFATFSTEHDNSLIRGDLAHHTTGGGGRYGGVGSDLQQCFERRTVMRCDAVVEHSDKWNKEFRKVQSGAACDCARCSAFHKCTDADQARQQLFPSSCLL